MSRALIIFEMIPEQSSYIITDDESVIAAAALVNGLVQNSDDLTAEEEVAFDEVISPAFEKGSPYQPAEFAGVGGIRGLANGLDIRDVETAYWCGFAL